MKLSFTEVGVIELSIVASRYQRARAFVDLAIYYYKSRGRCCPWSNSMNESECCKSRSVQNDIDAKIAALRGNYRHVS